MPTSIVFHFCKAPIHTKEWRKFMCTEHIMPNVPVPSLMHAVRYLSIANVMAQAEGLVPPPVVHFRLGSLSEENWALRVGPGFMRATRMLAARDLGNWHYDINYQGMPRILSQVPVWHDEQTALVVKLLGESPFRVHCAGGRIISHACGYWFKVRIAVKVLITLKRMQLESAEKVYAPGGLGYNAAKNNFQAGIFITTIKFYPLAAAVDMLQPVLDDITAGAPTAEAKEGAKRKLVEKMFSLHDSFTKLRRCE